MPVHKTPSAADKARLYGPDPNLFVLRIESERDFEAVRAEYYQVWDPEGRLEYDLVNDIILCRWRLRRLTVLETATINLEMDIQEPEIEEHYSVIDDSARCALAFAAREKTLTAIHRHETRLRRNIDRATLQLTELQAARRKTEAAARQNEPVRKPKVQNEPVARPTLVQPIPKSQNEPDRPGTAPPPDCSKVLRG